MRHRPWLPSFIVVLLAAASAAALRPVAVEDSFAYRDPRLPVERRVDDLLGRLTLDEKVALLAGATWMNVPANDRLGIPALKMTDGPLGVRSWEAPSTLVGGPAGAPVLATAFPAGVALAATWNPALVGEVGQGIGRDARALGRDMLLGPTVNIQRVPLAGRNFESFSEDPYLAARLAVAYVKGVQAAGVIATVKHFAANNQEQDRHTVSAQVDERVLHEIYLPAFRAAVQEAGAWAVMSAYNKLNGRWCAENRDLLTDVLKTRWGFRGFVVSDWVSTHSTADTLQAGLDVEMPDAGSIGRLLEIRRRANPSVVVPGGFLAPDRVLAAMASQEVAPALVDDKVRRILRAMFAVGLFDRKDDPGASAPDQRDLARRAALESLVLLKNARGLLPLLPRVRSLAVIGPLADQVGSGGGSSKVTARRMVGALDGIRERAGAGVEVGYALGVPMEGEDAARDTPEARAALRQEASALAARSDLALVFVGDSEKTESEGFDRKTMELPAGQAELIQAVARANKDTVVVLGVGAPVVMDRWIDAVPAVLLAWFPGQEGGPAIAAAVFGDASPSGKLPVTFPKRWEDSPAYGHYPGAGGVVAYDEGLFVGYRHFDARQVEPLFPFGHGLSYTRFAYDSLKVSPRRVAPGAPVEVTLGLRNVGTRAGAEVVQLYVRDLESSLERPRKELKAFQKVALRPGERRTVSFTLTREAMAFYDPGRKDWVAEPGAFEVLLGASSRDIRLTGRFELAP